MSTLSDILEGREKPSIETTILLVESMFRHLRINENSRLLIYHKIAEIYNVDKDLLPKYTQQIGTLKTITEILEGTPFSAAKVNQILCDKGVLKKESKTGKNGKITHFWSIETAHQVLGQNRISPYKPDETIPMWYAGRKDEILKIINS